jgi:hypothetical protein
MLDGKEVAKHSTKESCWIVIDSQVYDVTQFLQRHPGGAAVILKLGGAVSSNLSRVLLGYVLIRLTRTQPQSSAKYIHLITPRSSQRVAV